MVIPPDLQDRIQPVKRSDGSDHSIEVEVFPTHEAWFEVAVEEAWTAAYRIVPQEGRPVIAEVRVFPREAATRPPGDWSGCYLGMAATVPAGGLTARLLRQLRPGDTAGSDLAEGRKEWERYLGLVPGAKKVFTRAGFRRLRPRRHAHGGRRKWSDEDLLSAAQFYVNSGRRPVADLAARWRLTATQARDLLHTATEKGFLTAGRQGVKSRALTDRAKHLLAAAAADSKEA